MTAFTNWEHPPQLEVSVPTGRLNEWRERILSCPEFTWGKAKAIAWDYGDEWPAVAALFFFPHEVHAT